MPTDDRREFAAFGLGLLAGVVIGVGAATSDAKRAASAANGAKGGRPKKG